MLVASGTCLAAEWELGGGGGLMVYKSGSVSRSSGSVDFGIKPGPDITAFITQNLYSRLGGQIRYTFGFSDFKLSGNGTEATFNGQTHALHYDLLFYANKQDSAVRPYLAGGGGMKIYRGTGAETLTQPLGNFAILTKTQEIKPLISIGGGVKWKIGQRTYIYLDVRDYITPAPKKVIAPVTGANLSGWLNGFTPMVGISIGF